MEDNKKNPQEEQPSEQQSQPVKEMNLIEAMNTRISVRSYSAFPSAEQQEKIKNIVENPISTTPFNTNSKDSVRLLYIPDPLGFKSSIGVIKGNKHWLCGAIKKTDPVSIENYGFILEWVIIQCTRLGLGTVWLGGSFTIAPFNAHLNLKEDESLIAVSPVGVPGGGSFIGSALSFMAGSRKRKDWNQMFFEGGIDKKELALDKGKCDEKLQKILEAVRLGPSAINKQPWIIVKEVKEGNTFWHFFRRNYNDTFSRLDIGIAMCHWQLGCEELEYKGQWEDKNSEIKFEIPKNVIYVRTWVAPN